MYELNQVGANSYYIQSPAKIGVVKLDDKNVCLIDSGNDKDAGRKILKILNSNGWNLVSIYNTHSNADHIGGNKYLQSQTNCNIYAPGIDCDFTNHTILEPSFLYGGFPPKDLRHKFLMAQESKAEYLTDNNLPDGMSIINLRGHFFDMVGYHTKDNVVYLADCLSSKETIEKYKISFIYDVASYINTLEMIKKLEAAIFVPSHADVTSNIIPLAQFNINKVLEVANKIVCICNQPICFEKILQKLFCDYELKIDFEQYVLVGSTVRSYLSYLKDNNYIDVIFENGQMLWKAV